MDVNDLFKNLSIGSGLGSAAGGIASLFGNKGSSPAKSAMPYLQQIPQQTLPFFADFINSGKAAQPGLQDLYSRMTSNPTEFFNNLAGGFKESPGYQFKLKQGLGAAGNAAAAGGMLGTPMHQQQATEVAEGIAGEDFYNWLNQIMGILQGGIGGEEKEINRGFDASKNMSDIVGGTLGSAADLAYKGKAGSNAQKSSGWSDLVSGLATAAPWLLL